MNKQITVEISVIKARLDRLNPPSGGVLTRTF